MLTLPLIFLGCAFCLGWAYALGRLCLYRLPASWEVALAIGAAAESTLVFALLAAGWASLWAFVGIGAISIALAWRFHGSTLKDPPAEPAPRVVRLAFAAILAAYGVFYSVHALAPEIQSDGFTYHLGFASEYARTGQFPDRVAFFEMVPQGMELLFTVAFSIGRHSAAKLVHFSFLLATVPLLLRIGRRLRLPEAASMAAAGIYFCAPVAGISGTCSYNDAAVVFYILTVFYLLLVWREQHDDRYLLAAGIAAGFCYAIKFTGIIILPVLMLLALAVSKRLRPVLFAAAGLAMIAPWMIRDALLSGNPVAPLFNRWFPNPYFHSFMEEYLSRTLRSYGGYGLLSAPWQLAIGGHLQGLFGPLLLAMPIGLLALRRREGRWCWLAAAIVAVPWLWNIGGRFFMPAYVSLALALVMAVPRAATACLLFQAVTCWPNVIPLYQPVDIWNLEDFPWRAALRIEPESRYLARTIDEYRVARMIDSNTQPGERVFALQAVASAYTERESLEYWHSAQGDRLLDTLRVAGQYYDAPFYDVKTAWSPQLLRAMRFRLAAAHPGEWCIHEVQLYAGDDRIHDSPQWTVAGWPNPWEIGVAFDNNLATRWRTWTPMRAGMFAEVTFDRPQLLSSATLVSHTPVYGVPMEFYGKDMHGRWLSFGKGAVTRRERQDLRRQAAYAVRREGFQYILAPTKGMEGVAPFARVFVGHEAEWGLEDLGEIAGTHLYRIHP